MFRNRRNAGTIFASIVLIAFMAALYTACTPGMIPLPPIFASTPGAILPQAAVPMAEAPTAATPSTAPTLESPATPTPAPDTPTPVPDTPTSEPSPTAEEELPSADTSSAATVPAMAGSELPVPANISHLLRKREACLDCHEVETGKNATPADHQGLTNTYCIFCHTPAEGKDAVPPLPTDPEPEFCLGCHGPYEEIIAHTRDSLVDDRGVMGNPHSYIPHASTNIISCDACHTLHVLPVTAPKDIPQASIQYCYRACHHEENFEPCQSCHEDDAAGE